MTNDRQAQPSDNDNRASDRKCGDTGGQPIGGDDSRTGTGTTLTQGADFPSKPGASDQSRSGFIGSRSDDLSEDSEDSSAALNDEDEAEE